VSCPDRILSSFTVLLEVLRALGSQPSDRGAGAIGRLLAHILVLRRLSRSVAEMLQAAQDPALQAALAKNVSNVLEQETAEVVRFLLDEEPDEGAPTPSRRCWPR